jgi:6,7-dimethyl-8-ribityllumazine synthase
MTSSDQRPNLQTGRRADLDGHGIRVAIACSRFNDVITDRLLAACRETLIQHGVTEAHVEEHWVPGAFELPMAAKACAQSGRFDAVITIGAVIRGDTPHFDFVAGEAAAGMSRVQLDTGVPVVFGVLTTDTVEQAHERSSGEGNKGVEFAEAAIEMAALVRSLR